MKHINPDSKFNTYTFPKQHNQLLWRLNTQNNAIEYAIRFNISKSKNNGVGHLEETLRWMALGFRSAKNTQEKCQKWKSQLSGQLIL